MLKPDLSEKILQSGVICVGCSENGQINYISANIQEIFSRPSIDFIGQNVINYIARQKIKDIIGSINTIKHSGKSKTITISVVDQHLVKGTFSANINYKPTDGFFCVLMPQSEHEDRSEESSFRRMEVMRTTLESVDDLIFVLDRNGLFSELYSHSNESFLNGISSAFKVGSPLSEVGFPDDVEQLFEDAILQSRTKRKPLQIKYSIQAFGGELFYIAKISPRFTIHDDFDGVTIMLRDVTGTVKSEGKLKKSLEYYLTVLNNFPNPIWRANTFKKFDYFNKTWVEFTGVSANEQHDSGWHNSIYPPDLQSVIEEFDEKFLQKNAFTLEYRLIHASGNYRWVKNFCQPLYDLKGRFKGYMGSCFDIDDIRNTQKLLLESESRYRAIVQEQNDLVVRWKADMTISFVNKSFCQFFGKSIPQLLGINWITLFNKHDQNGINYQVQNFIRVNKAGFFETEISDCHNYIKVYQWLNSPVFDKIGNIIEYQSVGRDITEKIEKDKENQNLLLMLNEKVKELSLLNKISRFINEKLSIEILLSNLVIEISETLLPPMSNCASIEYAGNVYKSRNFSLPPKYSEISYGFGDAQGGIIKLFHDERMSTDSGTDFMKENEKALLRTICEMLNSYMLKLETEKKLMQSELRFSELFESVLDIVFKINKVGKILKINAAANRILGFSTLEGKNLWNFAAPSDKHGIFIFLKKVIDQKRRSFTFETKVMSHEGNMVYLQIGGIIKYGHDNQLFEIFGIARDITEQRRLEQQIMKTAITTEEKERKRFAEDLHDGIGPLLSGLKMYLQQETLEKNLNEKQQKVLKYCRELVDDAIGQTRSIANNITPSVLNDFGLEKALKSYASKINAIGKFTVDLNIRTMLDKLENEVSLAVYRVVSELMNNALKHSGCNHVEINIDVRKNILSLTYMDNGRGFDLQKLKSDGFGQRMGLNSINNRVHSLNGSVSINAKDGDGVFVKIYLPLKV